MTEIVTVASNVRVYVRCINASKPTHMEVDKWLEYGKPYRLLGFTDAINAGDVASFMIADVQTNKIIKPNADYWGFRSDRFAFDLLLNHSLN